MKKVSTGILFAFLAVPLFVATGCGDRRRPRAKPLPPQSADSVAPKIPQGPLAQGPMVGFVSDREAKIWVRMDGPRRFRIRYRKANRGNSARVLTSKTVETVPGRDYTAVIPLTGLEPDTAYRYSVTLLGNGGTARETQADSHVFRTLPPAGAPGKFRIAFGSCASVDADPIQEIWKAVSRTRPRAFLWLGDNIYNDSLQAEAFRKQYRRQRGVRNLLDFQASVAQLAIWDDHDFGMNDGDRTFPGKETSLKVFREYWANPQYGLPGQPGVFFRWSIGDVDFFFLDTRTYRDPDSSPNGPKKTQLGAAQKRWLKSELKKSRGTFKVLAASGGWTESRGRFGDNWGGFLHERNEIFNFIRDEGITGVFLLSGDSHRSQLNYIPWSEQGGYDLYEAMSSPLAQGVYDGWFLSGYFRHIRPDNVDSVSFGLLEFDTAARPARVTIRFFGPGGKSLWEPLILTADDLRPGVKSWDKK